MVQTKIETKPNYAMKLHSLHVCLLRQMALMLGAWNWVFGIQVRCFIVYTKKVHIQCNYSSKSLILSTMVHPKMFKSTIPHLPSILIVILYVKYWKCAIIIIIITFTQTKIGITKPFSFRYCWLQFHSGLAWNNKHFIDTKLVESKCIQP